MNYLTSKQWPILQSKSETKHKSGLFTVSAEFIRPVGSTALPLTIPSSIGLIAVWPLPTVSKNTDGFERINATGYGSWATTDPDIVYNYSATSFELRAKQKILKLDPDNPTQPLTPIEILEETFFSKKKYCIFESAFVRKIGPIPPAAPSLRVLDFNGENITNDIYYANMEFPVTGNYQPGSLESSLSASVIISSAKINTYGQIQELETNFEIATSGVDFGLFVSLA